MRWAPPLLLLGCAHELPDDQACVEIGYAIASRTAECEGDDEAGVARFELFESSYTCAIPADLDPYQEPGLFECAFLLRNLACELVEVYGDDLQQWLTTSAACDAILDPA